MSGAGLSESSVGHTVSATVAEAGTSALLQIRGLKANYGIKTVLESFDLEVRAGELVTLLGANGSGKSTALRCLVGLRPIDGGEVLIAGTPLGVTSAESRRRVAMVFQAPQLVKRRTVIDNVCSGGARPAGSQTLRIRGALPALAA